MGLLVVLASEKRERERERERDEEEERMRHRGRIKKEYINEVVKQ